MEIIAAFIIVLFIAAVFITAVPVYWKWVVTVAALAILVVLSSIPAIRALAGNESEYVLQGTLVTGPIPVRIDALSGLFILIINFTFLTGVLYGRQYMKVYRSQAAGITLHCISLLLAYAGLTAICSLQNAIAFLTAWEIMAIASFLLVIFEHHKKETLQAGINFLIQSHICVLCLTLAFIWVAMRMHSFDFHAILQFSSDSSPLTGVALFLCFFTGFAIKAGFVPFHTWLPYAHPAAPAHVSGIMSGVIIKIGIYGILRMLLLIKSDHLVIGYIILFFSLVTGVYGVMLAIVQHNLKRLLAYHSIENIGIIGIGIGLGCIGMAGHNNLLAVTGFAGALLHTLNHSLFKSLLFYGAGNVYQAIHTMDIEKMGGFGKQMPHTAALFLVASLAICGLPPFNGFVSEFLIYSGMFNGLRGADMTLLSWTVGALFSLALIGGLALLCFTKAFGIVFLGNSRYKFHHPVKEANSGKLLPMYMIALPVIGIGLFPTPFVTMISAPLHLFVNDTPALPATAPAGTIGACAAVFIVLAALVYLLKRRATPATFNITWGCGYTGASEKMQYTASSFIRAYRKLAGPVLSIRKKKKEIDRLFPQTGMQETHPYDKAEAWFIDRPLQLFQVFLNRFGFLQNGNLQLYILYGMVFITLIIGVPFFIKYVRSVIEFLNKL